MSIDARIDYVLINEDGSGELRLIDRPINADGGLGIRGQIALHFDAAPEEVTALNGLDIWGGDGSIILGRQSMIAQRVGYQKIVFVEREKFLDAVKKYHENRRELVLESSQT